MILRPLEAIIKVIIFVKGILRMNLDIFELCSKIDFTALQENRPMTNIAQILLSGEGYVRTAVRHAGVEEKYITGNGSDFEKFRELCRVYPFFEGNVAQYVCRAILSMIFGIKEALSVNNCERIWTETAELLVKKPLAPADLLKRFGVNKLGVLTHISCALPPFEQLDMTAFPVLCPDSVFSVGKRGYKKKFTALEKAFGESISCISAFDAALIHMTERFTQKGCNFAVVSGLCAEDFGKSDYFHAQNALTRAIATDGNISAEEARDFRRYAIGKFLENCREKKIDVLLEFSAPEFEILPDIKVGSSVERRIWLNFSENETPLAKEGFIDLREDLQEQFSAYSKRFAIGNLPPFFVGSANLCELCLHEFYRSELQRYAKKDEK